MESRKHGRTHVVRLDRGETVMATLSAYVAEHGIPGGSVLGIGSIENTEIGYFVPKEKRYEKRLFPEARELLSLVGTISRLDGAPFIHAHVTLAEHDYRAIGGHLFEARVAVTGEFVIQEAEIASARIMDSVTGLKLMRFERDR